MGNGQVARILVTLGTVAILARLLSPEAFGVIAAVIMVAYISSVLGDFGLSPALTRAPEIDEGMLNCAFWANLALSLLLAVVIVASAGWIAMLFGEPALVDLLRVSALIVPLAAARNVSRTLLERDLAFRKVAIAGTVGTVSGSLAGIGTALAGAGVWALVIQQIVSAGGGTVAFLIAARWRPRFLLPLRANREIFRFGVYLTLSQMAGMLAGQAVRPIISRNLGLEALGIYTVAAQMIEYPIRNVAAVLQRIVLPVFSRVQDDDARQRHMHLAVTHGICLIVLPMLVLLAMLSSEVTLLVLGPGWGQAADLLAYLAAAGMIGAAGMPGMTLLIARNRAGLIFRLNTLSAVVLVLAQLAAVRFGLEAIALARVVVALAMAGILWTVSFRQIGQSLGQVGVALAPLLASGALMALAVHLLRPLTGPSPFLTILLCSAAGLVVYAASEALLDRARSGEIISALLGQFRRRG